MKIKILFIYTNYSTFVKTDYEILTSEHEVKKYQYKPVKGVTKNAVEFTKQFFHLLFNIWKFDAVFIWFADYHSFLPVVFAKITGKKSFVVVGGYDICRIPTLNYGAFVSKFRGFFASQSMKLCTSNLTVSNYVDRKVRWIFPKAKTEMIYNSVRLANEANVVKKKDIILTVGQIDSIQTFIIKGIDTFLEVAKLLPEYEFIIVGIDPGKFQRYLTNLPDKIHFYRKVKQTELIQFYSEAKIYAQFSRMDTFCLTLAESMLFGCYPIITNKGGMPEVVGRYGRIVNRNPSEIASVIRNTTISTEANLMIIDRIKNIFSYTNREKLVLRHISKNCNSNKK